MKTWVIFLFALMPVMVVTGQDSLPHRADSLHAAADSLRSVGSADTTFVNDDNWISIVMLVVVVGFVATVFAGVVVVAVLCGLAAMLTVGGILSFSVIMGVYKRSLKTGVRWAVFLLFGAAGAGAGVMSYVIFLVLSRLHISIPVTTPVLISGGAGLLAGLICGALFLFLLRRTYEFLQKRLAVPKN